MALSKFDNLWQLMVNHNLEVDGPVPESVVCSICKKLMSEPYVATCGCQFCGKCIKSYISNGRQKCPGSKLECNEEYLEMDKTVLQDYRTRINLVKTVVKCPYSPCSTSLELSKMENHLLVCEMLPKKCPFESLGCTEKINQSSPTEGHLNSNVVKHSQMLIEINNSLKRDIDKLKEQVEVNVQEINLLKEDERRNKRKIDDMKDKNRHKETVLTEEINVAKRCMFECLDKVRTDTNTLSEGMRSSFDRMRNDLEQEWEKRKMLKTTYTDIEDRVKHNEEDIKIARNDVYRTTSYLLSKNVKHDFVWSINNFSTLKGWYQSEPFSKDNYKLCLGVCIGSDNVYLYLSSLRGDKDDQLPWPMGHTVTLTIVNQSTMTTHKSDTYKYDAMISRMSQDSTRTIPSNTFGQSSEPFTFGATKKNKVPVTVPTIGGGYLASPFGSSSTSTASVANEIGQQTNSSPKSVFGYTGEQNLFGRSRAESNLPSAFWNDTMNTIPGEQNLFGRSRAESNLQSTFLNNTMNTIPDKPLPSVPIFDPPRYGSIFRSSPVHQSPGSIFGIHNSNPHAPSAHLAPAEVDIDGSTYNMWCLWISIRDLDTIPGLVLNDTLMVCCQLDK